MAAAGQDVNIPIRDGVFNDVALLTAVKVYEGAVVSVQAAGYAKNYVDTDTIFAGFAERQADNTNGASGALTVKVRRDVHYRRLALSGAAIGDIGDLLYASDESTFTKTSTNNLAVGTIAGLLGTALVLVRIEPDI